MIGTHRKVLEELKKNLYVVFCSLVRVFLQTLSCHVHISDGLEKPEHDNSVITNTNPGKTPSY